MNIRGYRVPPGMYWTGKYDAHGRPIFAPTADRNGPVGPQGPMGEGKPSSNSHGIQGSSPPPLVDPTLPHQVLGPMGAAGPTGANGVMPSNSGHYYPPIAPVGPRGPVHPHENPLGPPAGDNHTTDQAGLTPSAISALEGLLKHADTSQLLDPSLADSFAAGDLAQAQAVRSELAQLPSAKAAALKSIMGWYGDVRSTQKVSARRNERMAQAGARSMDQAAEGIAASLGGSANPAAGQIGAIGANNANTMRAIGVNDRALANDLGPIFKLAQADAGRRTTQQFDEGNITLQNALAEAMGRAKTDRAQALMSIMSVNNAARQNNFSNKSSLFSTIADLLSKTGSSSSGLTSDQARRASFVNRIAAGLMDPNNPGHLLPGMTPQIAMERAQAMAISAGLNPADPAVYQTVIGPALSMAGIAGPRP